MEKMSPTESTKSLVVVRNDANGKVIACGYTVSGKFGYFICEETYDVNHETYKYDNITHFVERKNDKSYHDAIQLLDSL